MFSPKRALLYAFLLAVLLEPILGRKGFSSGGHSYPKSGGLSGGGHRSGGLSGGGHSYPSSGASHGGSHGYPSGSGLSGSGSSSGAHKYPSSGGSHGYPSSGGTHGYPSSGGTHGYPSSGGTHGYPPAGGSHGYPAGSGLSGSGSPSQVNKYPSSSGTHTYPSSGGTHTYPSSGGSHTYPSSGGSHNYPSSGGGLSGNRQPSKPIVHHTTHVHNYHYAPPQRIAYTPVNGGAPIYYPVYHSPPPTYVYQYKNSGSKYGTLLAGLALLNLGTLAVAATAHSGHSGSRTTYTPVSGEVCKFAVKRDNGDYEETKIDCQIISSFILQDQEQARTTATNTTTSVVTVTNTTVTNMNNMMPQQPQVAGPPVPGNVTYIMLPNGTLVNTTGVPNYPAMPANPINMPQNAGVMSPSGVITSVTTTTTNTTLVNALDVKGDPVRVTPGMQCFVIRTSPVHNMRKNVPCGLLQTYADKSLQRKNSAARNVPLFTTVAAILAFCLAY